MPFHKLPHKSQRLTFCPPLASVYCRLVRSCRSCQCRKNFDYLRLMPASKKRIQNRGTLNVGTQQVPAALKDWVHIWHGVKVNNGSEDTSIFHAGSRVEEMPFWKQFIRLPANSLFPRVFTSSNPRKPYKDFLYVLLNMRWPMLLTVLLGVFMANIFFFAAITCFVCGEPTNFFEAFDLSYQTFTTIGFGIVYPTRTCGNVSMSVESFASMMVVSAVTGLVFAKFAKPQAKVAFSKVCVVQPYGKKYLALVVRVANATQSRDVTHDVIMEAVFKVNLLRVGHKTKHIRAHDDEVSEKRRRSRVAANFMVPEVEDAVNDPACSTSKVLTSYNLKLLQNNFITFRMGVAVVHVIDENSPLYGMSKNDIAQSDMLVEVAMSGVDSTLQDTVSERYIYTAANLKWGFRFAELLDFNEKNAEVIMNFAKLSTVEAAPIDDTRYLKRILSDNNNYDNGDNGYTRNVGRRRSYRTSRVSRHQEDNHDEAIHEVPAEYTEPIMESSRSNSDAQSATTDNSPPAHPHPPVLFPKKNGPKKFAMGLEPLFEPLLQQPFGTQRISKAPSAETRAAQRGGLRVWRENEQPDTEEARRRHTVLQLPRIGSASVQRRNSCGMTQNNGADFESPSGLRARDLLQREMAGSALMEDDTSTISQEEDKHLDVVDDVDSDSEDEAENDKDDTRPRLRAQSSGSAVSIEVEDTPRFLRILPVHIPKSFSFMRFYQSALHVGWPKIIFVFVVSFLALNFGFGFLYWLDMSRISVYEDIVVSDYELAFYMSVHTLATIGYGSIAPKADAGYMNVIVFIESMVGIITVTIITGIAWSKFARPRAHIHFSSQMTISTIYGHRCLVFRAANTRHSGEVHENFFRIGVILTNRRTGLRQMYDVPLVTAEWPSIKLPATLIHVINENSPFFKFHSMEDLSQSRVAVIALLTGLDTTFSENVYARKMYFWDDFAYDMRFADFAVIERDRVLVDYTRFDQLIPEDRDEQVSTTPVLSVRSSIADLV
ncbi:Inward rectifier potassium channel C-terminal domain [Phytophthora infestans]|uniref:Inward rectifier potassium channel C-terminal domain n=1 Tax=Phytophthora infestans TaxID=4787 RepID=A0A8S9UPU9_PHYIN|nr:Inward rectifier potassium channel C-terminal domain [Phytophthora infestans]